MAFYDDRKFLLSHIHHSFIISDDTGMCETVMLNEVVTEQQPSSGSDNSSESAKKVLDYYNNIVASELLEAGQSYDIMSDMALIADRRYRCNTAQRLERLKNKRQLQATVKNIQWKMCHVDLDSKKLAEMFPKKDLSKKNLDKDQPKKSALTEALEHFPAAPNNPFSEYARFDGRISRVAQTKKISIFLTMLSPKERQYPMEVISLATARVQDLIGLICWQYTSEGREPKLKPGVNHYCLRIAEETGDVDEDFPSLDPKELVAKFGFPVLALVERETPESSTPVVSVYIADDCMKLELPSHDFTLKDTIDQMKQQRKWLRKSMRFHIEKLYDAGIPLPLDKRICDLGTTEFRLVLEDSTTEKMMMDDWNLHQMTVMEAPLYQSFIVSLTQKMGRSYVQLGISEEKVEINPLPQKGAAKLLSRQQKPATYHMDTIACCEMISKKYNPGKSVFKIVQKAENHEFKSMKFETDNQTAQDIVRKLQAILDMRYSNVQKEYQLYRERKLQKKMQRTQHNFTLS